METITLKGVLKTCLVIVGAALLLGGVVLWAIFNLVELQINVALPYF